MLTIDDIDFSRHWPNKGRFCIFTDADRPCATMLVFVHGPGEDVGTYYIEYIRPTRMIQGKIGPVQGDDLTPIEHFGFRADYDHIAQVLVLRPGDKLPTAHYKGKPDLKRQWQGHTVTGIHQTLVRPLGLMFS